VGGGVVAGGAAVIGGVMLLPLLAAGTLADAADPAAPPLIGVLAVGPSAAEPRLSPSPVPSGLLAGVLAAAGPGACKSESVSLAQPTASAKKHNHNDHRFMRVSCSSPLTSNAHATRKRT
jgi:hypothetical protein